MMPVPDGCLQPHSLELHLDNRIKVEVGGSVFGEPRWNEIDLSLWDMPGMERPGQYPLMPGQFILASTVERVKIPVDLAARADGKSSIGRRGVGIHVTAGLLDAGWEGTVTLEMTNHSGYVFWLKPGMKICQLTFEQLTSPAERPYGHPELGSHYQGQSGPTISVL
jgi:dCTP deaminase